MERLGVGRQRCPNGNEHHYLHALSPQNLSHIPERNLNLFFLQSKAFISVASCGGLLCFESHNGRTVICNLTTQELKFLPPTPRLPFLVSKKFKAFGFGYDSTHDDYKVIRHYSLFFHKLCADGTKDYNGSSIKFELYSFRHNSWREIPTPYPWMIVTSMCGSPFVNGSVYWMASYDTYVWNVLSFDFATETFSWLSMPRQSHEICFHLVKIDDDTLGAVLYSKKGVWKFFEVWMWRRGSWSQLYDGVFLYDVERPLELKDGRLLFLGRKSRYDPKQQQLVVYDWVTKELKELDIYDYKNSMMTISYVESGVELPNAMPIGYYSDEASWNEYWRGYEAEVNELAGDARGAYDATTPPPQSASPAGSAKASAPT